jgi:hypothetical protein
VPRALQNRASAGGLFFAQQRALQNWASAGGKFAITRANGIQRAESPVYSARFYTHVGDAISVCSHRFTFFLVFLWPMMTIVGRVKSEADPLTEIFLVFLWPMMICIVCTQAIKPDLGAAFSLWPTTVGRRSLEFMVFCILLGYPCTSCFREKHWTLLFWL